MFNGYEKVKETVDKVILDCGAVISQMNEEDEYEGTLRLIVKSKARTELVHRCCMLILEGLPETDLRELFSDEIYDDAENLYDQLHHSWGKRNGAIS